VRFKNSFKKENEMKGEKMHLRGEFVVVDGKKYFKDEVLGLISADHFTPKKKKHGDDDEFLAPLEYKGSEVDGDELVRSFRGPHIPGR